MAPTGSDCWPSRSCTGRKARPSSGQASRLEYLHALLNVTHFDDAIRYQLLHRTASAILMARAFHAATAVMLVHAFGTPPARQGDFRSFCSAMSAKKIAPQVFKVPGATNPTLYLAWCAGNDKYREVQLKSVV